MDKTPYEILGVPTSASQDEIRDAYRKLAKKFHPDLNPGNKTAEKNFKDLSAAYEKVGTAEQRAKYDRGESEEAAQQQARNYYHQTQQNGGRYTNAFEGFDDDILSSIFGKMHRGQDGSLDIPGEDTLYQLEIEFRDAILGAGKEITLPNGKRLHVKIPAGIDSGAKLKFSGQGAPGVGKANPGDAYIQINIKPSPTFKRQGKNLEVEIPVSVAEAILGAGVKVPTIDGSILLKIPPHVSSGQKIRVAGKGVPALGSGERGDLYVKLKITVPPAVDEEFKKAVEEWTKRQPFHPRAET